MLSVQGIYLSLLLKCSNHIGLLLPSFIASDKQNEKVLFYHDLFVNCACIGISDM